MVRQPATGRTRRAEQVSIDQAEAVPGLHMTPHAQAERRRLELSQIRRLEAASLVEGSTLVLLLFVAAPLKHLGGWPAASAMLGPAHGLAFLFYVWTTIETASGGGWTRREVARLLLVAFVPFGGFANLPFIRRKAARLV
jgi:integral membrane protein